MTSESTEGTDFGAAAAEPFNLLVSLSTGHVAEVQGAFNPGSPVNLAPPTGRPEQSFTAEPVANGSAVNRIRLRNTNLVLEVAGGGVGAQLRLGTWGNTNNQRFTLEAAGSYRLLRPAVDGALVVEIPPGKPTAGALAPLRLGAVNLGAKDHQKWVTNFGLQPDWRYCEKCSILHFGPAQAASRCPKDNGIHSVSHSGRYALSNNNPEVTGWDTGWRFCDKCKGMFSLGSLGVCPVDHAEHSHAQSGTYILPSNMPPAKVQTEWTFCVSCTGLWFYLDKTASVCPKNGGSHIQAQESFSMFQV